MRSGRYHTFTRETTARYKDSSTQKDEASKNGHFVMENLTGREQNGSNPTGDADFVSEAVFQTIGGLSIVIMLIGIPGNFLVIASISLNKHMRTAANFLVLSLSGFDSLFLCTMVPVHSYNYITGREPPAKFCWAVGFISNWLLGCSVLSTGSIAINRYIVIVLKSKYRQINGNKAVIVTCAIVFLFPFFLLSPSFEGSIGTFGFEQRERNCSWKRGGILKIMYIACVLIFPLIFMTLCYIRIVLFVVTSRKRVAVLGQTSAPSGTATRSKETRMSLMLAMVYVVYVVTTLPSLVVNLAAQMRAPIPMSVLRIAYVGVWISSVANPVMYGLVNKKYRDAYKTLAGTINCTARRTETGTNLSNSR